MDLYSSQPSYPLTPSGLIKSPLPPNFGQQEQSLLKLGAMQKSNEQLKMDTYLAPDQQETFNSLIQNYDIPPIQLPKF